MRQIEHTTASEPVIPAGLSSPQAKLVYLYVATQGEATIDELSDELGMQKLALYSVVRMLRSRDLLQGRDTGYRLT
jgi:predicted transcriptional regulator